MDNSVLLSVGETYHLKHGKDRIIYAGMPSENVYSIVQEKERARERRISLSGICLESFLSNEEKRSNHRRNRYSGRERYSR